MKNIFKIKIKKVITPTLPPLKGEEVCEFDSPSSKGRRERHI